MSEVELAAAALLVATGHAESIRPDPEGKCVFCGGGWPMRPGPRGGAARHVYDVTHHLPGCAWERLAAAVAGAECGCGHVLRAHEPRGCLACRCGRFRAKRERQTNVGQAEGDG